MSYKSERTKRRIEEIKGKALKDRVRYQNIRTGENGWVNTYTLAEDDFNFLVKKAERVHELEEVAETDGSAFHSLEKLFMESEQQNKRYREALMTIAVGDDHFAKYEDIARDALEAEK